VKTNLGHLEPAAGISGLIKVVLCLGRGQVPPNLHFSRWNPQLSAKGTRFFVPTEMTSWPGPGDRGSRRSRRSALRHQRARAAGRGAQAALAGASAGA